MRSARTRTPTRTGWRSWGPGTGARERTAATALLLVLVLGAAHATRGAGWPAPNLLEQDAQTGAVTAVAAFRGEPPVASAARQRPMASPRPRHRVRTIAGAELPPVRAPDPL